MAGTALLLALATITLCVLVDPYWVFGTPTLPGWTALKPRAAERSELAKTYLIQRSRPRTVLLGNSRMEVGLNPESQEWPQQDRPVFNGSLAGRELSASVKFLRKALAPGRVNLVVLGVDYPDFLKFNMIPLGAGSSQQLRHSGQIGAGKDSWEQVWRDRLNVTLSIDAVTDSLMTLLDQSPHTSATMTRTGLDPRRDYTVFVQRDGYYSLFAQKRRGDIAYYRPLRPLDFRDLCRIWSFGALRRS